MAAYMEGRGLGHAFSCPELPYDPAKAIALLDAMPQFHPGKKATLVGSSLGGFYATWLAEKHECRAVLIQPAIVPHIGLEQYIGPQSNLYTGATYELTANHLASLRALYKEKVDPERYLLLLETGDEVLDYREAVRKYEGARMVIRDGGDHTLQSFPEHLPRILAFAGLI